jgi:hypothetical protein
MQQTPYSDEAARATAITMKLDARNRDRNKRYRYNRSQTLPGYFQMKLCRATA